MNAGLQLCSYIIHLHFSNYVTGHRPQATTGHRPQATPGHARRPRHPSSSSSSPLSPPPSYLETPSMFQQASIFHAQPTHPKQSSAASSFFRQICRCRLWIETGIEPPSRGPGAHQINEAVSTRGISIIHLTRKWNSTL